MVYVLADCEACGEVLGVVARDEGPQKRRVGGGECGQIKGEGSMAFRLISSILLEFRVAVNVPSAQKSTPLRILITPVSQQGTQIAASRNGGIGYPSTAGMKPASLES